MKTEYRVLKEISLLTLAQAGPKGCGEFKKEYESLINLWKNLFPDSCGFSIDKLTPYPEWFLEWAEEKPKRIQWLIDKGFIERVELELKPCPFHPGDNIKGLTPKLKTSNGFFVECQYYKATGPCLAYAKDAIEAWDRRV